MTEYKHIKPELAAAFPGIMGIAGKPLDVLEDLLVEIQAYDDKERQLLAQGVLDSDVLSEDEFDAILTSFDAFAVEAQQCAISCLEAAIIKARAPSAPAAER
jgi:hypothetical protein